MGAPGSGGGYTRWGAAAVIARGGRFALVRNVAAARTWWGLPGGRVEPGETIGHGLVREVGEETGVAVRPAGLLEVREAAAGGVHRLLATFRAGVAAEGGAGFSGDPAGVVRELRWASPDEAGALIPGPVCALARAVLDGGACGAGYEDGGAARRVGSTEDRPEGPVPVSGMPLKGWAAHVAVLRPDGRVLALREVEAGAARWSLPGGAVEPGETLGAAVLRQLREEAGTGARLTGVLRLRDGFVGLGRYLTALFAGSTEGGAAAPDHSRPRGAREICWLPPDEAVALIVGGAPAAAHPAEAGRRPPEMDAALREVLSRPVRSSGLAAYADDSGALMRDAERAR